MNRRRRAELPAAAAASGGRSLPGRGPRCTLVCIPGGSGAVLRKAGGRDAGLPRSRPEENQGGGEGGQTHPR